MANNAYQRSVKREREIVNEARKRGCIAARSAGSKSPVDCYIFCPDAKKVFLIQVKTEKGSSEYHDEVQSIHHDVTVVMILRKYTKNGKSKGRGKVRKPKSPNA